MPPPTFSGEHDDAVGAEPLEREHGADDVDDRVERADFVQVHLLDRHLMDRRLRPRRAAGTAPSRDRGPAADSADWSISAKISGRLRCGCMAVPRASSCVCSCSCDAVVVRRAGVQQARAVCAVAGRACVVAHGELRRRRRRRAARGPRWTSHARARARLPSARFRLVERQAGVEQRAEHHVARDARETVEIENARHHQSRAHLLETAVPRVAENRRDRPRRSPSARPPPPAAASAPRRPGSGSDRRTDDCGTATMAAAPPSAASRNTSRGSTTVAFSVPTASNRRPQHAVLRVEQHDAELLDRPRAERRHQDTPPRRAACASAAARSARAPASGARARAPPAICAARAAADAGDPRADRRTSTAPGRAGRRARASSSLATVERVRAAAAAAEDERDQFVVAERRGAVPQQLLARPIVRRQVFHRTTRRTVDTGRDDADGCCVHRAVVVAACRSCARVVASIAGARAAIRPTRKCSRRRARSTRRAPPAPISTRATSSPPRADALKHAQRRRRPARLPPGAQRRARQPRARANGGQGDSGSQGHRPHRRRSRAGRRHGRPEPGAAAAAVRPDRRIAPKTLAALRQSVLDGQEAVQKARAAFDRATTRRFPRSPGPPAHACAARRTISRRRRIRSAARRRR